MFTWDVELSVLEWNNVRQMGMIGHSTLENLNWSYFPLHLSIPICTLEVEGTGLLRNLQTSGYSTWKLNMARLVKLTFQTWSTGLSTAQKNLSLRLLQILNSLFMLGVGVEGGKEPWRGDADSVTHRNNSSLSGVTVTFCDDLLRISASRLSCLLWHDHFSPKRKECK